MRRLTAAVFLSVVVVACNTAVPPSTSTGTTFQQSGAQTSTPPAGSSSPSATVTPTVTPAETTRVVPTASPPPLAGGDRPNIIVVMVDDLAQMDDRVWNRLPTIRETFVDNGIRFTDYVGNDPLCCPGRANFLTGQWAHHHGVTANDARLLDPRETIATELHDAGYWTTIAGKYLNQTGKLENKLPPGWDRALVMSGGYWGPTMWRNGKLRRFPRSAYSTDVIAKAAKKWVAAAPADQPLFMMLTPYATHAGRDANGTRPQKGQPSPHSRHLGDPRCAAIAPWSPPNYNEADRSDKPKYIRDTKEMGWSNGWPLRRDCEALLAVDEMLAGVLASLQAAGRTNNLVVLTGDNGMTFGAHAWAKKAVPYATPLPLFIRWDEGFGIGQRSVKTTASNVDIAPTLCAVAGCVMGPYGNGFSVDGFSLLGPILGTSQGVGRDYVLEEFPGDKGRVPSWSGVRSTAENPIGRWIYSEYSTGECELYDLTTDPWSLTNHCKDPAYASTQATLAAALGEMRTR